MTSGVSTPPGGVEWHNYRAESYHQYLDALRHWRNGLAEVYLSVAVRMATEGGTVRSKMAPQAQQQLDDALEVVRSTLTRVDLVASRPAADEARRTYEEILSLTAHDGNEQPATNYGDRSRQIAKVTFDDLLSRLRDDLHASSAEAT